MNRITLLSMLSVALILPLLSCGQPTPSENIRNDQIQNQNVNQLRLEATTNMLVEGERTRLTAYAMIGTSVQSVTQNTTIYVEGPGEIAREDGNAYYVATSETGENASIVHAVLDPTEYGGSGKRLKSNRLHMFVHSREEEKVTMPSTESFQTKSIYDYESD